jgi:hypothetical protein
MAIKTQVLLLMPREARDKLPPLIDQVEAERLIQLQSYRRLCRLVGKQQAKALNGRMVRDVALEE